MRTTRNRRFNQSVSESREMNKKDSWVITTNNIHVRLQFESEDDSISLTIEAAKDHSHHNHQLFPTRTLSCFSMPKCSFNKAYISPISLKFFNSYQPFIEILFFNNPISNGIIANNTPL